MAFLLVVDDDANIRETLCDLFSAGHFCQSAETAEQALALLESDPFDVVLTDISMPGLSGLELLGIVRERWPELPVIIISGIRSKEQAQGMIRMGAFDYLLKPFQLEDVEASVNSAIEHHRRLLAARQRHADSADVAKPKMYVLSLYAENKKTGRLEPSHEAAVVIATTEDGAKRKGFKQAHQKWPIAEGWSAHNVVATEVQRDIISQAALLILKEATEAEHTE